MGCNPRRSGGCRGWSGSGLGFRLGVSMAVVVVVGIIDCGPGPVGGGGRMGLVPVAGHRGGRSTIEPGGRGGGLCFLVANARRPDIVEDAPEAAPLQDVRNAVVAGNPPEIGAGSDTLPLRGGVVPAPLLVEVAGDQDRNGGLALVVGVLLLLRFSVSLLLLVAVVLPGLV